MAVIITASTAISAVLTAFVVEWAQRRCEAWARVRDAQL
ncbi:hypothetical protein ACVWWN_005224 [Mycobacterium sp. URHB0021]|jgi:hypothetical protein